MEQGASLSYRVVKRCFDVLVSLQSLLLLLPILLFIGLWVKLDSPGPIFYLSRRMGKGGRPFTMYKFRTMYDHSQPVRAGDGSYLVQEHDARVTRSGQFLRTGLDELPQLLNVLLGQMSLIGPRADPPEAYEQYSEFDKKRLCVVPGITGLAQVNGRTDLLLSDRRAYDVAYVEHPSLRLDACIFGLTFFEVMPFLGRAVSGLQAYLRRMSIYLAADQGVKAEMAYISRVNMRKQYVRRALLDCGFVPTAFLLALYVQCNGRCSATEVNALLTYLGVLTAVHIIVNALSGIYRRLWALADLRDAWLILRASAIATLLLLGINLSLNTVSGVQNGVIIVAGMFNALLSTGFKYRRFLLTATKQDLTEVFRPNSSRPPEERAVLVGATPTAQQVAACLAQQNGLAHIRIIGYLDDDAEKAGMTINGIKVLGVTSQIPNLVAALDIDMVIIAMEEISRDELWRLISVCQETPAQIKVLPDVIHLMNQQYEHPLALRELHIEDLLKRQPLQVDDALCRVLLKDKVVLVTGAAGSIGSELCYQLCRHDPAQLLLLDNNESGLFDLSLDLNRKSQIPTSLILADITNRTKMDAVFRQYRPHIVFHAAAYKHVPLVEVNPDESLRVNIRGTMIVSEMAHHYAAQRFVFVSTDKAVNPSCVMGASKYACELWLRALNKQSSTMFTAVRFGNVIGSRGSVLPIFTTQIARGGPVTVTHKEMKRFFMSIPEAATLVIQAAAFGRGGEVFMLDMGEEVRIQDLAERMIRLKGLRVHKDIPIHYIGVRPGEKLREELSYDYEQHITTPHPRIFQLQTDGQVPALEQFRTMVDWLETQLGEPESGHILRQGIFQLAAQPDTNLALGMVHGQTAVENLAVHMQDKPKQAFA